MRIVTGSGKARKIYDLVHGSVVKSGPEKEQRIYVGQVCDLLGVKGEERKAA